MHFFVDNITAKQHESQAASMLIKKLYNDNPKFADDEFYELFMNVAGKINISKLGEATVVLKFT